MPRLSGTTLNGRSTITRRSDRFLAGLTDFDHVTFVSHVNPDPDALASMLGLAHMVESTLHKPTRLTCDGQIFRAENRAMVELLDIKLDPVDEIEWHENEAIVMVDSQPNTGRHSIDGHTPIYAVIDHHQTPGSLEEIQFQDIRMGIGATCSLVTRYLIEQDLNIPIRIATALYYGIETELSGYPREASPIDDSALQFLYPLADHNLIAAIRNARLPLDYFDCVLTALQSSFIYDNLMISWVNDMPQPELAAQVVDFMIRFEKIEWAVCAGVCGNQLILSVRTSLPNAQSGEMLRQVAGKLGGRAGGHDRRAGGFIPLTSTAPSAIEHVQGELRRSLLKALHIDECRGQRLVPVREQLENLQA